MNESTKSKIHGHLITFCLISYTNSLAFGLFQNFLFDIVNQNTYITFRWNCALQIMSLFNFCGSFFWTYLADCTKKHHLIQVFNANMYGLLVAAIFGSRRIESQTIQIIAVLFITMMREFTLGSFGGVSQGLFLNYLIRNNMSSSLISFTNISQNLGVFSAMFFSYIISITKFQNHILFCKMIMYIIAISISSFLLIFFVPRFQITNMTNEQYAPLIDTRNRKNIIFAFKKPSLILFYIVLTIAGIYKCIISNFVPTFLRIHDKSESITNICFTTRSLIDLLIYLPLSRIREHRSTIFIISIFTSAISLFVDIFFDLQIFVLTIGEILKGFSRSTIIFSSIIIFKSYATPETLTQTQGLRNSAYNGFSCIIFGFLALILIPKDLIDPKNIEQPEQEIMKEKMIMVLDNAYKYMSLLLLLSLMPAFFAKIFRKKKL